VERKKKLQTTTVGGLVDNKKVYMVEHEVSSFLKKKPERLTGARCRKTLSQNEEGSEEKSWKKRREYIGINHGAPSKQTEGERGRKLTEG